MAATIYDLPVDEPSVGLCRKMMSPEITTHCEKPNQDGQTDCRTEPLRKGGTYES